MTEHTTPRTNRRTVLSTIGAGLTAGLAGCTSVNGGGRDETRTEQRSYDIDENTALRVSNPNGRVTVEGDDGDELAVDIEVRGASTDAVESVTVTDDRADGTLRLETEYEDRSILDSLLGRQRASVLLTIRCPAAVSVELVETTNGEIDVRDVAGDPTFDSTNGDVTARNVDGSVSLSTTNGSVLARGIEGFAGAETTNGSIEVDVPAIDGDTVIESTNGRIDAALGSALDADLSASTTNGTVTLHDLDFDALEHSGTSANGSLGDGTHELIVETTNGSIDLRAQSE